MDKVLSLRLNELDQSYLTEIKKILKDTSMIEASDSVVIKTALSVYATHMRHLKMDGAT